MAKKNHKKLNNPSKLSKTVSPRFEISNTLVDIVIPVRGRFDLLQKCLDAIPAAFDDISYNVIIVDNASKEVVDTEEVRKFYEGIPRNIVQIGQTSNLGFPTSCNFGARRKNSPLIFFLNSDCILDPGAGTNLVLEMDDPEVGVAGMKLRFASEWEYADIGLNPKIRPSGRIQHVGLSVNVNGDVYHPFIGWTTDNPKVNRQHDTFAVTGAALMVRRNLFNQVGGFFEGYGLGTFEDVDLCMMIRELGKKIVVCTQAEAVHYTGATIEQLQTAYPLHQNANLFRSRWMQKMTWWDFFIL